MPIRSKGKQSNEKAASRLIAVRDLSTYWTESWCGVRPFLFRLHPSSSRHFSLSHQTFQQQTNTFIGISVAVILFRLNLRQPFHRETG